MQSEPQNNTFNNSADLPNDLAGCHSLIKELRTCIAELEKQLSRRQRASFGKKSAKVNSALLTGTGKAVHDQTADEIEEEENRLNIAPDDKHGGGRSSPPAHLPTSKEEHHLDPKDIPCPCCGEARTIMGFDVTYQLEFIQMLIKNIQHVVFTYACKTCKGQVVSSSKPYQPIDKGKAGPGLLAKIATDKFWLHMPLYRQQKVFTAMSIPIDRSSMCRWLKEIAALVEPIVKRMQSLILKSKVIQSDATTLPVIKKGLGKTHRGYIWVYRGDKNYPYVCYNYSNTEHSIYPEKILNGYKGILQTDGTNKYNQIIEDGATSAACWAHVHCRFEDAWKSDPQSAELPMGVVKSLFDIERFAATLSEDQRKDIRQRIAKPKIDLLKTWLDEKKFAEPPKTKLGEAISYTINRWPALLVYLDHPNVEISNNGSERSIKPMVLSRKNWLFAGSEEGGHTAATIMTLVETCNRLKINPLEYLKDVLTRLPSAKTSQIDDFLPDRWLSIRQSNSL